MRYQWEWRDVQRLRHRFFKETKSIGPSDLFIGSEEEEASWV